MNTEPLMVMETFAGDVMIRHAYGSGGRTACGQFLVGSRWESTPGLSFAEAVRSDRAHCYACKKALHRSAKRKGAA